jgi:hypothetical protein
MSIKFCSFDVANHCIKTSNLKFYGWFLEEKSKLMPPFLTLIIMAFLAIEWDFRYGKERITYQNPKLKTQ